MKSFTEKQSAFALIFIFILFCWMSDDDFKQAELAQQMADGRSK